MAKEIIKDKDVVFAHYAIKNPVKLAQRKEQYEAAIKAGSPKKKEFEERLALIEKALAGK